MVHGALKAALEIDLARPCRAFDNPEYPRPRATLPLVACPGLAWRGPLGLNSFERDAGWPGFLNLGEPGELAAVR